MPKAAKGGTEIHSKEETAVSDPKHSSLSVDDVKALLEIFAKSGYEEMHLVAGGLELFVSSDPDAQPPAQAAALASDSAPARPAERKPPGAESSPAADAGVPEGLLAVKAPNLGVFYSAPKPGADPYVKESDRVEEDTPVGLVEVMKLFTTIHAGVAGVVREIRVANGDMVEHDQVLMLVEPDQ